MADITSAKNFIVYDDIYIDTPDEFEECMVRMANKGEQWHS